MSSNPEVQATSQHDSTDPFDDLLTLEDTLYTTAYDLGVKDGSRAGRIEGRVFGLEKGFEKFAAMGVLHGRACVWGGRLPASTSTSASAPPASVLDPNPESNADVQEGINKNPEDISVSKDDNTLDPESREETTIPLSFPVPRLPQNPRLPPQISLLHGLTDPSTFSTENTEDAVADFDDRFKRAGAKAKVIERMVGESDTSTTGASSTPRKGGKAAMKVSGERKKEDNMEDFGGSRLLI